MSISMFCKGCLDQYFGNNVSRCKSCPSCKQSGLSIQNIKPSLFVLRCVKALKVTCELNHNNKDESSPIKCHWNGSLGDLTQHIQNNCPLFELQCPHCGELMKRIQMDKHVEQCEILKDLLKMVESCKKSQQM